LGHRNRGAIAANRSRSDKAASRSLERVGACRWKFPARSRLNSVSRLNSRGKTESARCPLVVTVRAAEEPGQTGAGEVAACSPMRTRACVSRKCRRNSAEMPAGDDDRYERSLNNRMTRTAIIDTWPQRGCTIQLYLLYLSRFPLHVREMKILFASRARDIPGGERKQADSSIIIPRELTQTDR